MSPQDYEPSPVPSDADLWPGELPFTAWGQHVHGTFDLRVLDQDIWWVDIDQRQHRLARMSDEYIRNVIAHLEDNAEHYYTSTLRRSLIQIHEDMLLGRIPADVVADALGATPLSALTPTEWLEGTPLMRALRRQSGHQTPG